MTHKGKKLEPYRCPFCGGPASLRKDYCNGGWLIGCARTHHMDPLCCPFGPDTLHAFNTRDAAVRAWNSRTLPRPLTRDEKDQAERRQGDHPAFRKRLRRRGPVIIDLTHEIETAFDPFTCPDCKKTYDPPCQTRISPRDYVERCPDCAEAFAQTRSVDS